MENISTTQKIRERLGYTRAEVAEKIGVSRQSIRLIEIGRVVPSVSLAQRLAKFFGRTVEDLFPEEG